MDRPSTTRSESRIRRPAAEALVLPLLLTLFAASSLAFADDWPVYRGPGGNGVSTETGWVAKWSEAGPNVAWKKNVGIGAASFVVVGERVITTGNKDEKDTVHCLNAADGKELWKYEYDCKFDGRSFEGGTACTPTVEGDVLYNLSYDGQLQCLKLADGSLVWKKHVINDLGGKLSTWKYACSPLVEGELLIVDIGGDGSSTVALEKKTGEKVWGSGKDLAGYATPMGFNQGDVWGVMVFKGKALVALKVADGTELWRIPWEAGWDINAATPIISGDKFFISCGWKGGRGAVFQLTDGEPKLVWEEPNPEVQFKLASGALLDGYLYGVSQAGGRLMCVEFSTGKIAWSQEGFGAKKPGEGSTTIAGGKLIVQKPTGELVIAEATPEAYKPISTAKVLDHRSWVCPVLANGRIYCRDNLGNVVCLDVRK